MRSRGFTLIEMMISLTLMTLITVGFFVIVLTTTRTQQLTQQVQIAQSGARAGLEFITRDAQTVSAGSSTGQITLANGTALLALTVTNSSTGPDRIDMVVVDPTGLATLTAAMAPAAATINVDVAASFAIGDLVEVTDYANAVAVNVNAVAGQTIAITPPTVLPVSNYPAGSMVFRLKRVAYYVDTTMFGAPNPLLMKDPDGPGPLAASPLAEGIEDFQVALGYDFNGDGVITEVGTAAGDDEWVFNVAGEVAPLTLTGLKAIRITIVARTSSAETSGVLGQRPAAEDHAGAVSADGYPRRVLRSEIAIRNFNL